MYLILLITASMSWFTVIFEGGPKAKALPKESVDIPLMFFIAVAFSLSVFGQSLVDGSPPLRFPF